MLKELVNFQSPFPYFHIRLTLEKVVKVSDLKKNAVNIFDLLTGS